MIKIKTVAISSPDDYYSAIYQSRSGVILLVTRIDDSSAPENTGNIGAILLIIVNNRGGLWRDKCRRKAHRFESCIPRGAARRNLMIS